ncbi:MAG: peptidylprolyl isomerase [Candidatus ainarchaeum sp.]|nr:peptidylprolyl isomerase [Candidatus ainarchaeum sp.]MDD5096852.1 peptidylprolyl isomerase [Candidatus ainarchaeum sp.]
MVNKGDLILLGLEGRDGDGNVFDSTSGEVAKRLHGKEGPLLLSYGFDRIIPGLFEAIGKMGKGEEKSVSLGPDKAFGRRKKELVKIMSLAEFRKYRVNPEPGLTIHVDTDKGRTYGTVKSVSNGRVMVDFNHPFAGQQVDYKIMLVDVFEKQEDRVRAICEDSGVAEGWELKDGVLKLRFKELKGNEDETRKALLLISLKSRVPGLAKIDIGKGEEKTAARTKQQAAGGKPAVPAPQKDAGSGKRGKPKTGN